MVSRVQWLEDIPIEGFPDMNVESHADVNGKWGGHKAWVVKFYPDEETIHPGYMFLYRCVGPYYTVGLWPGDYGPSKWEVMDACAQFIWGDVSTKKVLRCIIGYHIKMHWSKFGRMVLTFDSVISGMLSIIKGWLQNDDQDH